MKAAIETMGLSSQLPKNWILPPGKIDLEINLCLCMCVHSPCIGCFVFYSSVEMQKSDIIMYPTCAFSVDNISHMKRGHTCTIPIFITRILPLITPCWKLYCLVFI